MPRQHRKRGNGLALLPVLPVDVFPKFQESPPLHTARKQSLLIPKSLYQSLLPAVEHLQRQLFKMAECPQKVNTLRE